MKQLLLFKICDAFQLAHLYEHLYYAHIDTLFRDKGLYQPIDYSIDASTYFDGVIAINIEIYNSSITDDFLLSLSGVRLDITDERLDIGINQLIAEKQVEFQWDEYNELRELLAGIDSIKWRDADALDNEDLADHQTEEKGIIETSERVVQDNTLSVELRFNSKDRVLAPLYRQIAGSIINTLAVDISDSYGYFVTSHRFQMNEHGSIIATFHTGYAEVDQGDIHSLFKETMEDMQKDGALKRQLASLQNVSYLRPHASFTQPDPINTFEDTDMLIGSAGWKKIATSKNLRVILDNLEPIISYEIDGDHTHESKN